MSSSVVRELFGGAITAKTPSNLVDASDLRQIPDTQEVFLYPDSNISIIVEILEKVEPLHFSDAIRFHFDSLAHDNSAESSMVLDVSVIPNDRGDDTPSAIVLKGFQHIPKFNHSRTDEVRVLMALFRVERKDIDLLVTFNVPKTSYDGGAVEEDGWKAAQGHFDSFTRTLRIVDFGLFA